MPGDDRAPAPSPSSSVLSAKPKAAAPTQREAAEQDRARAEAVDEEARRGLHRAGHDEEDRHQEARAACSSRRSASFSHGNSGGRSSWLKWLTMWARPTRPMTRASCLQGDARDAADAVAVVMACDAKCCGRFPECDGTPEIGENPPMPRTRRSVVRECRRRPVPADADAPGAGALARPCRPMRTSTRTATPGRRWRTAPPASCR